MRFKTKGFDRLIKQLGELSNPIEVVNVVNKALEKGADVVADATRTELMNLKVDNRRRVEGQRDSITQLQKNALLRGFGISEIQKKKNNSNIKTGVNRDVNALNQPNVVIARRLENGTSYMPKNPVFSRASKKARSQCLNAMADSVNESINKLWQRQ